MLAITLGTVASALAAPFVSASTSAAPFSAPPVHAAQVARLLHQGGYVLVLRHAQSPDTPPSAQAAEPDNPHHERQLSDIGKANARALGDALHTLDIPIGPIYSSPTYRALETVRLAGLPPPQPIKQLTEGPRGMRGSAGGAQVRWLQLAVARAPPGRHQRAHRDAHTEHRGSIRSGGWENSGGRNVGLPAVGAPRRRGTRPPGGSCTAHRARHHRAVAAAGALRPLARSRPRSAGV